MRAMYSGALSIGALVIPIKAYTATESHDVALHQYCNHCNGKIRYAKFCVNENLERSEAQIVKGFEISKDQIIQIGKEEIEKLKVKSSTSIDISEFVYENEIDPVLIEKSYYLAPQEKLPDKAFQLFVTALEKAGKVAIGKINIRDREHLCAIRAYGKVLLLQTLVFGDEVREYNEIKEVKKLSKATLSAREIDMAVSVIDSMTTEDFRADKYEDAYTKNLRSLIEAKASGGTFTVPAVAEVTPTDDVMAALEATLKVAKK